ncbi:MAG TPA: membrane protein insertase YidC, partial [Candidatus Binatia bacterium]|nr:membrane protein insertase YidC [Candidatus Binatia bacterium]
KQAPATGVTPSPLPVPSDTGRPELVAPEAGAAPTGDVSVDTPLIHAAISSLGGRLVSLKLKHYRTTVDPRSPPLELIAAGGGSDLPLGVVLRGTAPWSDQRLAYTTSASALVLAEGDAGEVVLRGESPDGLTIEKKLRFDGASYAFTVALGVSDPGHRYGEAGLRWTHSPTESQSRYSFQGPEALVGGKLLHFSETELAQGVILPDPRVSAEPLPAVYWAGYADSYFISAMAPRENDAVRLWVKKDPQVGEVFTELLIPAASFSAGAYPFLVYSGPKDLTALSAVGHHLARTVDLGWFGFVAEPMLRILKMFHHVSRNYGIDIILLTMLVKLVTVPLTHKSFKSMRELQKLQPQMKRLQEKYADDRAALNKEVMELYRRHNVNPLGGCLPMIVQMPIFIGLYNALLSAVELRHAPFALWINDLSAPDRLPPITKPPLAVVAGTEIRIPVLTLLMGVSMLVQQRMTPQAGDPTQQRMMMIMPLVFTVMFINFPSGLALYWLVNNILTIAQQMLLQRSAR